VIKKSPTYKSNTPYTRLPNQPKLDKKTKFWLQKVILSARTCIFVFKLADYEFGHINYW
jgi:hypothetical protein